MLGGSLLVSDFVGDPHLWLLHALRMRVMPVMACECLLVRVPARACVCLCRGELSSVWVSACVRTRVTCDDYLSKMLPPAPPSLPLSDRHQRQ